MTFHLIVVLAHNCVDDVSVPHVVIVKEQVIAQYLVVGRKNRGILILVVVAVYLFRATAATDATVVSVSASGQCDEFPPEAIG